MKERWFVAECRMIRGAPRYRDVVAWAANPDDAARICAVLRGGTGNKLYLVCNTGDDKWIYEVEVISGFGCGFVVAEAAQ